MRSFQPLRTRLRVVAAVAALTIGFGTSIAHAGNVTFTVNGADGQPAANVVVQVVPANPAPAGRAAGPVVAIAQKDIRFVPYVTAVPLGTTVRFSNLDAFDHHVRSQPSGPLGTIAPAKEFEYRLAGVRGDKIASAEIRLDAPGAIVLGCHLHNSMRGHLYVSTTPFVAVTDASGQATITDAPDGASEVRIWHPEQVVDQPSLKAEVTAKGTALSVTLNISPRKRRS